MGSDTGYATMCLWQPTIFPLIWKIAIMLFPGYIPTCPASILEPVLNLHTAYVMTWSCNILRAIPPIYETNALKEVLWQWMGKFLLEKHYRPLQPLQYSGPSIRFCIRLDWFFAPWIAHTALVASSCIFSPLLFLIHLLFLPLKLLSFDTRHTTKQPSLCNFV